MRAGRRLLTRQDWIRVALRELAAHGVAGVAVDRLAKKVQATRGSFYWHFGSRQELIDACLEQWEKENTVDLIPPAEMIVDPAERLRHVFREVYEQPVDAVEIALASAADDPQIGPVLQRVTQRRLEFLRRMFIELGLTSEEAAERAWLAYGFYLGHQQLGRGDHVPPDRPDKLDGIVDLLIRPSHGGR